MFFLRRCCAVQYFVHLGSLRHCESCCIYHCQEFIKGMNREQVFSREEYHISLDAEIVLFCLAFTTVRLLNLPREVFYK